MPVKARLAMPIFLRRLLLRDLHHMFPYYEVQGGPRGTPEAFRQVLPDALSAEDWFRFHGHYSNGERIAADRWRFGPYASVPSDTWTFPRGIEEGVGGISQVRRLKMLDNPVRSRRRTPICGTGLPGPLLEGPLKRRAVTEPQFGSQLHQGRTG